MKEYSLVQNYADCIQCVEPMQIEECDVTLVDALCNYAINVYRAGCDVAPPSGKK